MNTNEIIKSWLRDDVRAAFDAAETIKRFCEERGNCGKCPFETNDGCLFYTETGNDTLTPAGWNLEAFLDN